MEISIRTELLDNASINLFKNILAYINDLYGKYADEIIVCDSGELEKNIKEIDQNISITNLYGGQVVGKTLVVKSKVLIFLVTEIISEIGRDLSFHGEHEVVLGVASIQALKTLFHELGHGKNFYEFGKISFEREYDNYPDYLNAHWKILRDEFMAEMFCAKIYEIIPSIKWYGDFTDEIEQENFQAYIQEYTQAEEKLNWNLAFQLLHQYYFVPLFQKAGFLEGMRQYIELESIDIHEVITKILGYQVISNDNVPQEFNVLVNEKWEEFQIVNLLEN